MTLASHWHLPLTAIAYALAALAAVKEFWFDMKYETGQTYADGLKDFTGYLTGIVIGEWI